ncbi:hypothetical protein HIV01_004115 [Lysobacter arenosi]|uniref:Uncharacterized protein n=1 Tax=Lysobacter arenosi TaxID=2795387 RepID=A0ABX7RE07_9GAMM|nr:hypothetical protein [Lysobacter arenosi]QSX75718.1 hypothetical protein HIV01_004115 [Lysobacter arenosi]
MDTQSLPAEPLVDSHCGGPSRSLCMAPVAEVAGSAAGVPPELVDLIAASLRAVCQDERDSDRAFWLIARIVDQHLAGTLSPGTGRWKGEAIDALMGMLSRPLQVELHRHLAE